MANEPSAPPPTTRSVPKASDYAMGSTDRERERLMRQGAVLRGFLASAFRAAGIEPGMRVLDLGCGVGDVAMLAADLVGPTGSVLGIDRDAASVAWANKRVAEAGYKNIRFQVPEFHQFKNGGLWISEVLRRSGARLDMGMRLYATYRDAGFVNTATEVSHL